MWDVCISSGNGNASQNGEKYHPFPSSLYLNNRTVEIILTKWGLLHFQHWISAIAAMKQTAFHEYKTISESPKAKFQKKKKEYIETGK